MALIYTTENLSVSRLRRLSLLIKRYLLLVVGRVYPFPNDKIFDSSKLIIEFADGSFRLYENGGKFCKRTENTVGKGEIARREQILLFQRCFQKNCTAET